MQASRLARTALAAALALTPLSLSAAGAATPTEVRPGMVVVDPAGGTVGSVIGVKDANVILKTDRHEVQLPMASFTVHEGKLLFGMTAAELNAETDKAMAEAAQAVAVGAQVFGSEGSLAGQIEAIDEQLVTIKLTSGETVRVPRSGVGGSPNGAILGITTAELVALAQQAN